MKTSRLLTAVVFAFVMLLTTNVSAQKFAPLDKSPMDATTYPNSYRDANKLVKVVYSRPQLKGREISSLAPNGKIWRTGANESVEITFYTDLKMGDKMIKAGTYSLATIPGDKEWTIIINSDLNTWGSYFYNKANDVARVTVPVSSGKKSLEAFSIAFDDDMKMHLGWGTLRLAVPFSK